MEGILNSVKGMFIKEDGGINWRTILGMGVGAVAGVFILPELGMAMGGPVLAGALGAVAGLAGSQLLGMVMPGDKPAAEEAPAGAGGPALQPPARGVGPVVPPQGLPQGARPDPRAAGR